MVPYFEFASWACRELSNNYCLYFEADQDVADAAVLLSKATTLASDTLTPLPLPQPSPALLGQEIPSNDISLANTHNALTYSPMDVDTSLASIPSTLMHVTPNTSLALLEPSPSLPELSPALLGQGIPPADTSPTDTSLTCTPEPAYNFFEYSPPDPQDNSIDLDFNRTILPMPPNYRPPSPLPPSSPLPSSSPSLPFSPLPSASSRINHDIPFPDTFNFRFVNPHSHGHDNTTLESPSSPPRLRHLSSAQRIPAVYNSTSTSTAIPTPTPTAIPALAQTPALAEIPAQLEPSMVVPDPPTPAHPVAPSTVVPDPPTPTHPVAPIAATTSDGQVRS